MFFFRAPCKAITGDRNVTGSKEQTGDIKYCSYFNTDNTDTGAARMQSEDKADRKYTEGECSYLYA